MNGELIGYTYPKRVKGLVKHGRAEIVDDTEIRLLDLSPPENNLDFSEERNMNILNFNPSDFRINSQCRNSSYSKEVITDDFLNNLTTYKIGDWQWNWCQIDSDAKLEKTQIICSALLLQAATTTHLTLLHDLSSQGTAASRTITSATILQSRHTNPFSAKARISNMAG